ncbi:MAG: M20 peptidase family dipeptidase, partial [Paracoccaceae bacterium]|nr:M20 peptidase family dipeptidase [Paracoccaceae bacterium]
MSRETAFQTVSDYFDDGRFQADLAGLVAFETESQNPDQRAELSRYLTEAMLPRLSALGFSCSIHDNPDPRGGPLLTGERHEGDDLPTILTYGHGDVIRAQTD